MRLRRSRLASLALACASLSSAALAQGGGNAPSGGPAPGVELNFSTDSDHTDVVKLLGRALWTFQDRDHYQGVAVERAWFSPSGNKTRRETRVYIDLADNLGDKWQWRARVGTNGDTILGAASLRSKDWSKEVFLEREIVETKQGLDRGIYYTFGGASFDVPLGVRDTLNVMGGVQEFTGKNVRLHWRGTAVHVLAPELGLSAQLRARYFHSTRPGEFDYYSPRDFVSLVPVLQMRRFDNRGWMYLAAVGYGIQKATGSHRQSAQLVDLRMESPARSNRLQAFAQLQYSNNSLNEGGGGYRYLSGRLGLTLRLK
ncbi:hypothetical protein [Sphingomonas flavescens]|uniref:hypothetical protein n=1 Tax=Sphingomonas flavescens TaxID=3132797 RepID=UPI0028063261|nr:hypothetical protein [Sphingomonas limnosediminicola]